MTTIAVLPVKRLGAAKQRLTAGALPEGTRRALVEAMVTDVLVALRRAKGVDEVLVVTGEPVAEALAAGYDASGIVTDPDDAGHSAAALRGIRAALERGAQRVLLVPGDCPALNPKELDALLDRHAPAPAVVVVPDRHGTGTNALVLTPPDVIEPAFGPGSRARHEELARAAGASCEVADVRSLALDIDTPDDIEVLQEVLAAATGGAAHTRGLLARLGRH
jgi:2-phospho-L-lactate guanylyltransferase